MPAYDKEVVRQTATRRWPDIIPALSGVPADRLDPRQHGPCPKCGGTDRFRALDDFAETGALFCNKCFSSRNGDGFAALGWLNGWMFKETVDKVGEYLGIEPVKAEEPAKVEGRKSSRDADSKPQLRFEEWSEDCWRTFMVLFSERKKGISEAAIREAGGRPASYKKRNVFAFPIIGSDLDLDNPTGWVVIDAKGGMLPKYNPKTKKWENVKTLVTKGSVGGLVGVSAVKVIKSGQPIDRAWKVEGITDLLALLTVIPPELAGRHVAVTNSNGCSQNPGWMASDLLAKISRVDVVHDADEPGQDGAGNWCDGILNGKTNQSLPGTVCNIDLGYEIAPHHGKDIRDRFNEGWTYADLLAVADKTKPCEDLRDKRKQIIYTPDEYKMNEAAAAAIKDDPTILQRGGRLVRVIDGVDGDGPIRRSAMQPRIAQVPFAITREIVSKTCCFIKEAEGEGEDKQIPPPGVTVCAVHDRGEWPGVPSLIGLTTSPVMRFDGSILSQRGYDSATGLYYAGQGVEIDVPNAPTKDDVSNAVGILLDLVCDFPFESDEHRSAWLAALLTPLARHAFDGPTPLFLIDANTRGSGKTLLADLIGRIVLGTEMARMSDPRDEDETRKRITAIANASDPIVLIDNLGGVFGNSALEAALTSTRWQDRILGRTEIVNFPMFVTWLATGNNVVVSRDMPRRVLHIRLQSPLEQPETRTEFEHPCILEYVAENREKLLSAALIILRAYFAAGKPKQQLTPWGGFEGWSQIVRGSLVHAGLIDPAKNRQEFAAASDTEYAAINSLLENWQYIDPAGNGLIAVDIHNRINGSAEAIYSNGGYVHLSEEQTRGFVAVREAILELCAWKGNGTPTAKQIGYMLRRIRSRVVGGKKIDCRNGRSHTNIWFAMNSSPSSPSLLPPLWRPKGDDGNEGDYKPLRVRECCENTNSTCTHTCIGERGETSPQSPPSPQDEADHHARTAPDSVVEYGGAAAA